MRVAGFAILVGCATPSATVTSWHYSPPSAPVVMAPATPICAAALLPMEQRKMSARIYFNRAMREDDLEEKIRNFELAYCVLAHPNVAYNLGRIYAELGAYEPAIRWYQVYLASNPDDREYVESIVEKLKQHRFPCRGMC